MINAVTGRGVVGLWAFYLAALAGCAAAPGPQSRLSPTQNQLTASGKQLYAAGDRQQALTQLEAAVEAAESPAQHDAALAVLAAHRGNLDFQQGRFEAAIAAYDRSAVLLKQLDDREALAKTLTSKGNLCSYLGDYPAARGAFAQALDIAESGGLVREQARARAGLGGVELRLREYTSALRQVHGALDMAQRLDDTELAAEAHMLLGILYREQADHASALEHYEQALRQSVAGGRPAAAGNARINLGELYLASGDLGRARSTLEQALAESDVASRPLWAAVTRSYLGDVALARQEYAAAEALYRQCADDFESMGVQDRVARALLKRGSAKAGMGAHAEAIELDTRAIAIYRTLGDRKWLAEALYRRGVSRQALGDLPQAERDYREAVDVYEAVRATVPDLGELRYQFNAQHAVLYERLIDLLVRSGRAEEALHYVNRSQTRSLREMLERGGISAPSSRLRRLIGSYRKLAGQETVLTERIASETGASGMGRVDALRMSLQASRQALDETIAQIRREDPELYRLLAVRPEDLSALAKSGKLPPGVVLAAYFPTETQLYVFVAADGRLDVQVVPVGQQRLRRLVAATRRLILDARRVDPGDWRGDADTGLRRYVPLLRDHLRALYGYLIEPLGGVLQRADILAVMPFGALHYLPFHALVRETSDGRLRFVVEDLGVVYVLPATFARLLTPETASDAQTTAAFGNPALNDPALDLPGAELEVAAIGTLFPKAQLYLGNAATKENFVANWSGRSLLHIAAHGELDPHRGPQLLLAPRATGQVTVADITALPHTVSDPLVTLSACRTALAADDGRPVGSELDSLAYSFTRAGARGVIATLWAVNDATTARLMGEVYRRSKAGGRVSYNQLREAQLQALHWPGAQCQPYYWAPFVYYGKWQ